MKYEPWYEPFDWTRSSEAAGVKAVGPFEVEMLPTRARWGPDGPPEAVELTESACCLFFGLTLPGVGL